MKQKEWVILIILMIVIAAVVAYITGSITGNIIKVQPTINGTNVYTKAEIDTGLSQIKSGLYATQYDLQKLRSELRSPKIANESYLLAVTSVSKFSGINYTKIKNVVTGLVVCEVKSGDDCKVGNVVITTNYANPDKDSVQLKVSGGSFVSVSKRPTTFDISNNDDMILIQRFT